MNNRKDYTSYTVEDFITDESYVSYYLQQHEEDTAFWTNWISLHPEKLDVIISANNYIDALSIRLSEAEFEKEQYRFKQALIGISGNGASFNEVLEDDWLAFNPTNKNSWFANNRPLKIIGLFSLSAIVLISLYYFLVHLQ